VTAIVFNLAIFGLEIVAFTLLRPYFKAIYEPRTYVPSPEKRVQPLSQSTFAWPLALFRADYRAIISANGLDAYFFVRFLRVMTLTFLPIWFISWAVLLPVDSVKTGFPGANGLDLFTFGNIAPDAQNRHAAHLILAYFFTFWILYIIRKEMSHFIITRQQHLIERKHSKSVQATTILVTGIPSKYLTQNALFKLFNSLPGGVKKIWINRDLKELPDIYDRRLAACAKLESAETALLGTATKLRLKAVTAAAKNGTDIEASNQESIQVPESERPTHKLGFLGLIGEKVDSINWAREEITTCTKLLEEGRGKLQDGEEGPSLDPSNTDDLAISAVDEDGNPRLSRNSKSVKKTVTDIAQGTASGAAKMAQVLKEKIVGGGKGGEYPPVSSAFITFERQIAAHLAVQVLAHHEPYRMSNRYIEVAPEDVIWSNLGMNSYEQKIRIAISYAITAALIIFWIFPVIFVGIVSNIYTVCKSVAFLAWICKLPSPVVGIISGLLPPVMLAVLLMLLPIFLRLLARFEGIPRYTGLELSLMTRFFIFQVFHSFLIVSLSSGIIASLSSILKDPSSIPEILAHGLPQASTFFLTYLLLQGLSGVAGGFLQIVSLIVYYVKLFLLGSTPRSIWGIKYGQGSVAWGTTFPGVTLLVVIALGYSIIAPIMNGFACAAFFLFYQLYKYLFLYVYQQPTTTDTGGLFYPKAWKHVLTGLYVQQICLSALFFLAIDTDNRHTSIAEGVLMVVLIVITAGFHAILDHSYGPLLKALPLSLQDRTYTPPVIEVSRADSSDIEESTPDAKRPSVSASDNDKLAEQGLNKDAPGMAAAEEEQEDTYGFAHPAASRPQRIVWIPKDTLGLTAEEVAGCEEAGVKVSCVNASLNEKGKVDIDGGPPDLI
jgi:hypothetical protein